MNTLQSFLKRINCLHGENIFMRLCSAWCVTAVCFLCVSSMKFGDLKAFGTIGLSGFCLLFLISFVLLTGFSLIVKKADRILLPILFSVYSLLLCYSSDRNYYFVFGLTALWSVLIYYYVSHDYIHLRKPLAKYQFIICVAAAFTCCAVITGIIGVLRYLTFSAPNYDFGIFCQAYHYLKTHFLPLTTCERDYLLSHFAVHASPILYLLLPVYAVFETPLVLPVMQSIIIASSAIPVVLLARKLGLSNAKAAVMAFISVLMPVVTNGVDYDFHENCFLLPLLLWMFAAFEYGKFPLTCIFALLTLCVKEDAAVYVIFFALYIILDRREYKKGIALGLFAAVWFVAELALLSKYGTGVMSDRYSNFIVSKGGLAEAVKNVLVNPGYVFTQIFIDYSGGTEAKLLFILQLFVPFAFIPLGTKRIQRLVLILPLLLVNLMTTYAYQYDIGYQYAFGSAAFLIYLSAINLSEFKNSTAKTLLMIAFVSCVMCSVVSTGNTISEYVTLYSETKTDCAIVEEALDKIPTSASVNCSTRILPHISNRDKLYQEKYHDNGVLADYVILDCRAEPDTKLDDYINLGYSHTETVSNNGKKLMYVLEYKK